MTFCVGSRIKDLLKLPAPSLLEPVNVLYYMSNGTFVWLYIQKYVLDMYMHGTCMLEGRDTEAGEMSQSFWIDGISLNEPLDVKNFAQVWSVKNKVRRPQLATAITEGKGSSPKSGCDLRSW